LITKTVEKDLLSFDGWPGRMRTRNNPTWCCCWKIDFELYPNKSEESLDDRWRLRSLLNVHKTTLRYWFVKFDLWSGADALWESTRFIPDFLTIFPDFYPIFLPCFSIFTRFSYHISRFLPNFLTILPDFISLMIYQVLRWISACPFGYRNGKMITWVWHPQIWYFEIPQEKFSCPFCLGKTSFNFQLSTSDRTLRLSKAQWAKSPKQQSEGVRFC